MAQDYAFVQYWVQGPKTYFAVAQPTVDGRYSPAFRVRAEGISGWLHEVSTQGYATKDAAIAEARRLLEAYFGLRQTDAPEDSALLLHRWPDAPRATALH